MVTHGLIASHLFVGAIPSTSYYLQCHTKLGALLSIKILTPRRISLPKVHLERVCAVGSYPLTGYRKIKFRVRHAQFPSYETSCTKKKICISTSDIQKAA